MTCSSCRRTDRAMFTRLMPERKYSVLCGVCLMQANERIRLRLRVDDPDGRRRKDVVPHPVMEPLSIWDRLVLSFSPWSRDAARLST
ncbi:hypothetical protein [Candidatus Nitrospira bockiana]